MKYTKGYLIKQLKEKGIRRGDKMGATVHLEHLHYADIVNLWYAHCK